MNQAATQALLDLLHNDQNGLPRDPAQLFQQLTRLKPRLHGFKDDRNAKLFPKSNKTNSGQFDIPLLADILVRCSIVPRPKNVSLPDIDDILSGNVQFPPTFDAGNQPNKGDAVKWLKTLRNIMDHHGKEPIPEELCDVLWRVLKYILQELGYDTTNLQQYRTMKFIMSGSTRQAAIQAVLTYMQLHACQPCDVNKERSSLSFSGQSIHVKDMASLKGLFFEVLGSLSLQEIKFYHGALREIQAILFKINIEQGLEGIEGSSLDGDTLRNLEATSSTSTAELEKEGLAN